VIAAPPVSPAIPVLDADPFDPGVIENPYPFHQQLREAGPVVWLSAHGTYGTGRFAEVQAVFRDWEHFTSAGGAGLADIRKPGAWRPGGPIVETDPPVHTQARKALNDVISPKIVRGWQERFEADAAALWDRLLSESLAFDAVPDVAEAYILKVFPDALGLDLTLDRRNLITIGNHNFNGLGPPNDLFQRTQAAQEAIADWLQQGQSREAMVPGGFGELIFEAEDRGALPPGTASPMIKTLFRGGMDTTISGIEMTLQLLAASPGRWRAVREDPARIRNAFEEAMRLESPVQTVFRTTGPEPVELAGQHLAADTKIQLFPGAANRDPRQWADPGQFDLSRKLGGRATWGIGIHTCIGQVMARLEAESLIAALARRAATLEAAGPARLRPVNALRTLDTLPLRVTLG
jgi:4-methoxybenzoate monooxygenase (O-demethylating)